MLILQRKDGVVSMQVRRNVTASDHDQAHNRIITFRKASTSTLWQRYPFFMSHISPNEQQSWQWLSGFRTLCACAYVTVSGRHVLVCHWRLTDFRVCSWTTSADVSFLLLRYLFSMSDLLLPTTCLMSHSSQSFSVFTIFCPSFSFVYFLSLFTLTCFRLTLLILSISSPEFYRFLSFRLSLFSAAFSF